MNLRRLSKFSLALLLMVLTCTGLYAQERKVTGKVVDQQDGQPIPGVNVSIKGKPSNVSTNAEGQYTIQVSSATDALVFSYIGYTRQTIPVGTQSNIDVRLAADNKNLDEVVVVGYGTQKKAHLTGSVVEIKASEIEDLPVTNIGAALAGRLLGVGVSGGISRPGSKATLTIRNPIPSFGKDGGSPQPLYVIDGIIQVTGDNQPDASVFNNIDPSEVESISILKDAAAAVYGVRGANGVVLVTTKKGKTGAPRISYNGSYSINDEAYRTKMMSAYEFGQYFNIMNGPNGANEQPGVNYKNRVFTQDELDYFKTIDYDRLDDAWSSSYNMRHAVNLSGGSDRATYFAGAAYSKQDGNLGTVDYNKWNFRAGADVKVMSDLKVGLQVSGNTDDLTKTFNKVSGEGAEDDYKNLLLAPRYVPEYVNGMPLKLPGGNDLSRYHYGEIQRLNNLAINKGKTLAVNVNLEYDVPFVKGLKARATYGKYMQSSVGSQVGTKYLLYTYNSADRLGEHGHIYDGATNPIPFTASNGNRLYYSNINSSNTQTNFLLNYDRSFGKHSISGLFSVEKGEAYNEQQDTWRDDPILSTNGQFNTAFGAFNGKTARNESGTLGYIGRFNYRYGEKYLAEFLFRTDASTKFAPENYWGKFYSGSLGWVISEEEFFKVKAVDFLKLRYSIGLLGNDQIKPWLWRQRYTFQDGKGAVFGDGNDTPVSTGMKMEASPNRKATWSQELKNNIGLDARFLNNRLSTTIEGYYNLGSDILIERTALVPVTVGGSVASENYGEANYFGYEVELGWADRIGKDFNYGVSARLSWGDDRIKKMNFNDTEIMYPWKDQPGKSSDNGVWGYDLIGMFKTQEDINSYVQQYGITQAHDVTAANFHPGQLYYRDVRGPLQADGTFAAPDGIIDENDQVLLAKRENSHYGYGLTLKAGYKGFSVDAVLSGSFGGWSEIGERDKLNNDIERTYTSLPSIWGNIYDPVINPTGTMPNPEWEDLYNKTSNFWRVSSFRMRVTSFNLNYSLPKTFVQKLGVSNARVYFTGMNPFNLFNPYDYKDPSASWNSYPNLKTYSFGLNLTL